MAGAPDSAGTGAATTRAWSGRSRGGGAGVAAVRWFLRLGGRDLCYVLLIGPALWFWLRDGPARRAAAGFWRRLDPRLGPWAARWRVLGHFWVFACTLADRLIAGRRPDALAYELAGWEHLAAGLAHPQGCILLSAHVGSFEVAARLLASRLPPPGPGGPVLNLVMLDDEDPRVQAQLDRALGGRPWRIIDLRDPQGAALALVAALGRGETCGMLGDRSAGDASGLVEVPFLGAPARLPLGPFAAAAATGAVIVPIFCVRTGWGRWRCTAEAPWHPAPGPRHTRRQRLRAAVERWGARLEAEVRAHPWNWNNYFDFWA